MNILVVGNVLKDVYLNLDSRTESFEIDKQNVQWLDISFDASEHHFFSRESDLGGAAVTLEVLSKIGLNTTISGSNLAYTEEGLNTLNSPAETYRYILISDSQPSYIVPTNYKITDFAAPSEFYDYLYIDRSAELDQAAAKKINAYLDISPNTKLIVYVRNFKNPHLNSLLSRASLVFRESGATAEEPYAPGLSDIDPEKLIDVSEDCLSYANIKEAISVDRIDILTHLSAYSITSATILGCFILGYSVEDSLRMARINVENSKLDSTLSLSELQQIAENMDPSENLELIAQNLVLPPKGILAADESGGSIAKKFANLSIPDTYENRRDYRNILFTTPDLENYINGVILFDETARQTADDGQNFVNYLTARRIVPGIKVDQGLEHFDNSLETYTKGLENLPERLREYYRLGLRFAKWRSAFQVYLSENGSILTPTSHAIEENCNILAKYALECQSSGLVPIVEPELVYDGYYDINQSADITAKIFDCLFEKLSAFGVNLRACLLKCNMVIAGKQYENQSTPAEVGARTAEVLKNHVPTELAGVVFLSGGQTPEQATDNLAAVIKNGPFPWPVTFSFARALQDPALYAWAGDNANTKKAQEAFSVRLKANQQILQQNP